MARISSETPVVCGIQPAGVRGSCPSAALATERPPSPEPELNTARRNSDLGAGSPPPAAPTVHISDGHLSPPRKKRREDFKFGKILGEGSFSTVVLAKENATDKEFAMKILEKLHIIKEKKVRHVKREKDILSFLNHPFFVKLFFTFQDEEKLYFGLSYAKNGELLKYIRKHRSFDEACTRFYSAEIVSALDYLHGLGIIHRDLKPENILLNEDMHIQITDFGTAKQLPSDSTQDRANSFVGTAQYVSPELLTEKAACKSSDLWALGCIIYQLVAGLPPFRATNEYLIFQKIIKLDYEFPEKFFPKARDLVGKLLVTDPGQRLGCENCGGFQPLRSHPFFEGISWDDLHLQTPPKLTAFLPAMTEDDEDCYGNYEDLLSAFGGLYLDQSPAIDIPGSAKAGRNGSSTVSPSPSPGSARVSDSSLGISPRSEGDSLRRTTAVDDDGSCLDLELELSLEEHRRLLDRQAKENPWHSFVENNLIFKMGPVDKRKGLFARRRQLLLTEGPHLYYVDPINKILKGEIPWSPELRPEAKNFKTFFVHTPNRTYYLMDPRGNAHTWCKKIEEVWKRVYKNHQKQ
uniref:3-phosphoinositide-dependent protein kinase 1 n=1 Tax=Myxine glutinosa TaxID=7769 RepID=UPI00358EED19